MQRLKRVWNYWMNLDTSNWFPNLSGKIWIALAVTGYVLLTIGVFWIGYNEFDLRHAVIGKNYRYVADWERILGGCLSLAFGCALVIFGIRMVWDRWKPTADISPVQRGKKPYRRVNNRSKATHRRGRQ